MALFSKIYPEAVNVSCRTMVHQPTDNCCIAAGDMALACAIGSSRFFAFIYMANFLIKLSKDKEKAFSMFSLKTLMAYCKSVLYGISCGTVFITSNCLFRWILGRYTDISACCCSASIAGLSIFFEAPERRSLVITSYGSMAIDCLLRRLKELNILSWSKNQQTITFMTVNAVLMYLIKYHAYDQKIFWIFNPTNKPASSIKIHDDRSRFGNDKVTKWRTTFLQYFGTGIAVQAARLILSNFAYIKNPFLLIPELLKLSNMSLGAFLGFYVVGFQIAETYLQQRYGVKCPWNTILAGLIAGSTFRFQPSNTILCSAASNVIMLILQLLQQKKAIPKFPYEVALYCTYNGFLYHMRAMNASAVPLSFIRIMSLVTNKRSDYIYKYYANIPSK